MSMMKKIKDGFVESAETVSEKTVALSIDAKLKWELHGIKKSFKKELNELGSRIYQFHLQKEEEKLFEKTEDVFKNLNTLEKQIKDKENEIKELTEKETVDKKQLKKLRKDLEMGDGTIEQVVLKEDSPFTGKSVMDLELPDNVLLGAIVRDEGVIIPDGKTILQKGDRITMIGEKEYVRKAVQIMTKD